MYFKGALLICLQGILLHEAQSFPMGGPCNSPIFPAMDMSFGGPVTPIITEIVPSLQFGEISVTGDMPIGGSIKVKGCFPVYGTVAVDGGLPSSGMAIVNTGGGVYTQVI